MREDPAFPSRPAADAEHAKLLGHFVLVSDPFDRPQVYRHKKQIGSERPSIFDFRPPAAVIGSMFDELFWPPMRLNIVTVDDPTFRPFCMYTSKTDRGQANLRFLCDGNELLDLGQVMWMPPPDGDDHHKFPAGSLRRACDGFRMPELGTRTRRFRTIELRLRFADEKNDMRHELRGDEIDALIEGTLFYNRFNQ